MLEWRIRKEDDGDYLEIWDETDYAEGVAPDNTISGTAGQFKYEVKGHDPAEVLKSPNELDEAGVMIATVDNRTIEEIV